jgi:Ca2+-binding RTX toxin-like protein
MAKSILHYFEQTGEINEFNDVIGDSLNHGTFGTPSKHKIALTGTDGGKIVFKGDFKVDNGVITGGTVTGFTATLEDKKVLKAINYDIPFADLADAIAQAQGGGNEETIFLMILTADQTIGSKGDDTMAGISKVLLGGKGDDTILSSFGDKTIKGEAGNDTIVAGTGNDKLFGGSGRDVFAFTDVTDGVDRVRDFSASKDKFGFDNSGFSALGGSIEASEFVVGEEALTAEQHIIYDDQSGKLYWDEDGLGGAGKILLARVSGNVELSAANFIVDDFT